MWAEDRFSVSQNHSINSQNTSNQMANVDSERRGRSLYCCKYYEFEVKFDCYSGI